MKCKRCDVEMTEGVALKERYTSGVPDFPGQSDSNGQTYYPSGSSNVVTVAKCPKCGYSVTI